MTTSDPEHPPDLLHFAREVYARPGIQALCLRLQDEHNVDVVLLLMCCWYGCYRGELTRAQLAQAMAFSDPWRARLVQPLRQARRWLKSHPADTVGIPADHQETLRQRVKALELEAEFMQLHALAALFADASGQPVPVNNNRDRAAAIETNMKLYTRHALSHGPHAGPDEQTLVPLVQASLSQLRSHRL